MGSGLDERKSVFQLSCAMPDYTKITIYWFPPETRSSQRKKNTEKR